MPRRVKAFRLRSFYFFLFVTYGAFLPFFPTWLEGRGVRGVEMSALMALGPAMGVVGPPGFGALADWLGLRAGVLRVATAGGLVATAMLAVPGGMGHAPGFALLFAAMLVFSTARAPSVAMADVIAVEASKAASKEGAPRSYGGFRLWGSIGFLLASVVVGRTVDLKDAAALPMVLMGASAVTFLLSFALEAPAPARAARLGARLYELVADRRYALLLVSAFLGFGAHVSYDICFSLHLKTLGVGASGVGLAWALGVVGEVVLMAVSGRLLARAPAQRLLFAAHAGGALRWLLIATITDVNVLLALQPLHAISFALFWVTSLDHVKRVAPAEVLATAQGVFNAAVGAGAVAGMFVWGGLFEAKGGAVTFGAASVVAVCAAVAASGVGRRGARAAAHDLV